jgi:hypothetical protein
MRECYVSLWLIELFRLRENEMNAYCRRECSCDDFELAAYELAGIFASKGFGTAQHREAVAVLREFFPALSEGGRDYEEN